MRTKICIPVTAGQTADAIRELKAAESAGDLVEIRLDCIRDLTDNNLIKIFTSAVKDTIATCRLKAEGGSYEGDEERRLSILIKAAAYGASYIDLEYSSGDRAITYVKEEKGSAGLILSYHDVNETPSERKLVKIYQQMCLFKPEYAKISTYANSINDCFKIFGALGKAHFASPAFMCMGVHGQLTRLLAPKYRSHIVYASLGPGKESASGQIPVKELKDTYNFESIDINTKVIGVIGEHAENSLSKYMHNASFRTGDENCVYVPFKVMPGELGLFMQNFREYGFHGAAVTMPHKEDIIGMLDSIDRAAKRIAAVNTVVRKKDQLIGHNTDYIGAMAALKKKIDPQGKRVLVIGAGGAARAVCYGLYLNGAKMLIANRTLESAEKLASEFSGEACTIDGMYKSNPDIIINATPVGMYPHQDESAVKKDFLKGKVIFDIVYRPMATRLLKEAEAMGCETVKGYEMLLYQGIEQYKLWTGNEPDEALMAEKLKEQLLNEKVK